MARAMLSHAAMPRHPALLAALASVLVPALARAQTISAGAPNPERYLYEQGVCSSCNATDVTNTPRPQNLNPQGVSFSDCEQNLRMDFTLVLSGFTAADAATVQAWAGTVDCSRDENRGSTAGVEHPCWQVAAFYGPVLATTSQTITLSVYARDVLRYEAPPSGTDVVQLYDATFNASSEGETACHVQATDAAVPIGLYFIPVGTDGTAVGTRYQYTPLTDLVAPPPPCGVSATGGGGLVDVMWSAPANDPDRIGYGVWSALAAGGDAGCAGVNAGNTFQLGPTSLPACQRPGIATPPPSQPSTSVDDPTATSLTQTGLQAGELVAVAVASLDGTGNVGPLSTSSCATVEEGEADPSKPTTVTAGCGCEAAGATVAESLASGLLALGAMGVTVARRRRRTSPVQG